MFDPSAVPDIDENELLARYVVFGSHVRPDQTVKQDAFIPPPDLEMSVNRHRESTVEEIWRIGQQVAALRTLTLKGRADIRVSEYKIAGLAAKQEPIDGNPNHAIVVGWPTEKAAQKHVAQKLAAQAVFAPAPIG